MMKKENNDSALIIANIWMAAGIVANDGYDFIFCMVISAVCIFFYFLGIKAKTNETAYIF